MRSQKKKRSHAAAAGSKAKKNVSRRWKRGQSCSSNPQFKGYRDKVGQGYTTGKGTLTEAAVAKLNSANGQVMDTSDFDTGSVGGATFKTFATNFTDCTNMTFGRVHRLWSSNSAVHKEILAVLAAITEVIKENGGQETETEYFAALVTALDTMDTEDSLTATAYLLSLVMNRVPSAVLKNRFSEVSKKLLNILVKHAESESTSLIKSLLRCLASLLCAQDAVVWEVSSTQQIYLGILAFITHTKPKVRKMSQESIEQILKSSALMKDEKAPAYHPMAPLTAKHCIQKIEESGGGADAIDTLHVLVLVKKVFPVLAQSDIQALCETILKVMTLATPMVVACSMQTLYGLVSSHPKLANLGTQLNAQIITALYDYQPLETDVQPSCAWLSVMEKAVTNLCQQDMELGQRHLPQLFTAAMKYLTVEHSRLQQAAGTCMKTLLKECVATIPETQLTAANESTSSTSNSCIQRIVKTVSSGLTYQYHAAWTHVISVLAVMLEVIGKQCPNLMKPALTFLSEMRESPDFMFNAELDYAVGCAVSSMGPSRVLALIPLQITGDGLDLDFNRSWLVPVLQKHISHTELEFFKSYFMPLSKRLEDKSIQYEASGNVVASLSYKTMVCQLWSLLPSFCNHPTDLKMSFKGMARTLGTVLNERPHLRTSTLSALRKLIYSNLENEENRKELSRFAKNFLPILFNLFTQYSVDDPKDPIRMTLYETVKAYIQIAGSELIQQYVSNSLERMKSEEDAKIYVLLDLCICMLPWASVSQVKTLFQYASSNLKSTKHTLQKKSYRILEEICGAETSACGDFVKQELPLIKEVLVTSLASSGLPSKGPRLRCLTHIVKRLKEPEMSLVKDTIPEAILCTHEVGLRARQAAYALLVEMGSAMIRWAEQSETEASDVLSDYVKMIFAGLAGSPTFISATLLALTRIMYEFKGKVSCSLLDDFVEHSCVLLLARSREIVKSTLSFLQVLLSSFTDVQLSCYLDKLCTTLTAMREDAKHHFRFKTKMIYAKLIRKFGYKVIYNKSSDGIKKVLSNIQKTEKCKKKKKHSKKDTDEEEGLSDVELPAPADNVEDVLNTLDSDLDDDDDDSSKNKKRKNKGKQKSSSMAWLKENTDDNITDFMDVSAARSVSSTNPSKLVSQSSRDPAFNMAPDGRLLINDDKDGDKDSSDDDDNDMDQVLQSIGAKMKSGQGKKRKRPSDYEEESTASKYVAGGHGIHRPTKGGFGKSQQSQGFGSEYKSKKAGGDVKRAGKPDPYAYVQLNFQDLNKRKRAKLKGQFNGLMKGAKKGANKGSKARKSSHKGRR